MKTLSDIMPGIIEFRKELHRHPELAGKENWTCQALFFEVLRGGYGIFDTRKSRELVERSRSNYVN